MISLVFLRVPSRTSRIKKALDKLTGGEKAQLINYLKAAGLPVGLLINFGAHGKLDWRRLVKSR